MGCTERATVLLAYDPRTATAWLRDLVDAHPSLGLSLCPMHAERTSVPMGWERVDERRPEWKSFETESPFQRSPMASGFADDADPGDELDEVPAVAAAAALDQNAAFDQNEAADTDAGLLAAERLSNDSVASDAVRADPFSADPFSADPFSADPFSAAVQLEMSAFAEADALDDIEDATATAPFDGFQTGASWSDDGWTETDDDFDEIFGLDTTRADEASHEGVPFDTALDDQPSDQSNDGVLPFAGAEVSQLEDVPSSVWGNSEAETSLIAARIAATPTAATPTAARIDAAQDPIAAPADGVTADEPSVDEHSVDEHSDDEALVEESAVVESGLDEAEDLVAEIDEDEISFEDIFPPKVNQPEPEYDNVEESHMPPRMNRMAGMQTFAQRADAPNSAHDADDQRSLFGDDDQGDPRISHNKPVASAPTGVPTGPPRLDVRPDYLPSRQGTSSGLAVDGSSPLLGRAFGFVQRD